MKKRFLYFLILIIPIFLSNCNKDDSATNPQNQNKDIFPLAVGNQWIFKNTTDASLDTITITHYSMKGSNKVFHFYGYDDFSFDIGGDDIGDTNEGMFYKDKDLWIHWDGNEKIFIPYVRVVGATYLRPDSVKTITIVSENEKVTVPAGTFTCNKYYYVAVYTGSSGKYYWLADGIGLVKMQHESGNGFELQSSKIN